MKTRKLLARTAVSAGLLLAGCGTPIKAPLSAEAPLTVAAPAPTAKAEAPAAAPKPAAAKAEVRPARRVGNAKYGGWDEGAQEKEIKRATRKKAEVARK